MTAIGTCSDAARRKACPAALQALGAQARGPAVRREGYRPVPAGSATMTAGAQEKTISITADEEAAVDRLNDVIATHFDRFAFREAPLLFDWSGR